MYYIWETFWNKLEKHFFHKLFWPFTVWINCSSEHLFFKFWAFNLEFQKFFSITITFSSHSGLKQFWKKNSNVHNLHLSLEIGKCLTKKEIIDETKPRLFAKELDSFAFESHASSLQFFCVSKVLLITSCGEPLFMKHGMNWNMDWFGLLGKFWYFVTKIVLTYSEKKLF